MFQKEIRDIQKSVNTEVTDSMSVLSVNGLGSSRLTALTQIKDYVAAYVSGGVPRASNTVTGTVRTNITQTDPVVYTKAEVDNLVYSRAASDGRYLQQNAAANTYLTQTNAASTYLTQSSANVNFITASTPKEVTAQHNFINGYKTGTTSFITSNTKPTIPVGEDVVWFKPDDRSTLYSFGANAFVGRESSETHSVRNASGTNGRVIDANYFGLSGGTTYLDKVSVVYDAYTSYLVNTNQWEAEVYLITDTSTELTLVRFPLVPVTGQWSRQSRTVDYVIPSNYRAIGLRTNKLGTPGNITLGMTITLRPYLT